MANEKDWSAAQYLKFHDERTRPSRDLLARVSLDSPKRVIDLGCGPGNSTTVLAERYPDAHVSGMDSSPDMIRKARETCPHISFEVSNLSTYKPDGPVDLFFSNAVFQWIPAAERIKIIRNLVEHLPSGGILALQVPDNLSEPSHMAMQETAFTPGTSWEETLRREAPGRDEFQSSIELYDTLQPICSDVDVWRTTYYHVLENHEAIVEWVKGTGLRPFIDPLTDEQRQGYLAHYLAKLKTLYTSQQDGKVLLAYPRLFVVATRR